MDFTVDFIGTAGSTPSVKRGLPALLVRHGGKRLLIDCGEGTQRQLMRSVGLLDLDDVFITHLHSDHWLGLPGLIRTFSLQGRLLPLRIYGPPGTAAALHGFSQTDASVHELAAGESVRRGSLVIAAFAVRHPGVAYGYVLTEDARPGALDVAAAQALGVTPGPDFGRLKSGETVAGVSPEDVLGPALRGRKVVVSGDTSPCPALIAAAHQADLLVHEATFGADEHDRAAKTGHTTAAQAASAARAAQVRMLALTHISARYGGGELRAQARAIFANTELPADFERIVIPFPEQGPSRLIRPVSAGS